MTKKEQKFVNVVWEYYKRHGRRSLPWRKTKNPYRILISEVMLQQTQVERVIPRYAAFLAQFPTVSTLAKASLGEVLRAWQGLGYNRRARMLHECAKRIMKDYNGKFPRRHAELIMLPGIGHYTAGAVLAFAYNISNPVIETNIRSVYIHHFFNDDTDVSDREILQYVEKTLDTENVREWYWALMDYGVYIKKEFGNPNSKSKHYIKQSAFKGSDRQIRGAILRALSSKKESRLSLHKLLSGFDMQRIDEQLEKLEREGMIQKHTKASVYSLPQ